MAGMDKDYPEHFAAGLEPHGVTEKYYWVGRRGQPYNRVVDISHMIEKKVEAIAVNKSQGPGGSKGDGESGLCEAVLAGRVEGVGAKIRPGLCGAVLLYRPLQMVARRGICGQARCPYRIAFLPKAGMSKGE